MHQRYGLALTSDTLYHDLHFREFILYFQLKKNAAHPLLESNRHIQPLLKKLEQRLDIYKSKNRQMRKKPKEKVDLLTTMTKISPKSFHKYLYFDYEFEYFLASIDVIMDVQNSSECFNDEVSDYFKNMVRSRLS